MRELGITYTARERAALAARRERAVDLSHSVVIGPEPHGADCDVCRLARELRDARDEIANLERYGPTDED